MKVGQSPLGFQVMRVLRKNADQSGVVNQSRETVTHIESKSRLKPPAHPNLAGVRDRSCTRFKLKDIPKVRIRSAIVKAPQRTSRRLIEIQLAAESRSLLAVI